MPIRFAAHWLSNLRMAWESRRIRREMGLPLGARGERVAARFLQRKGVRVFARNYRVNQNEIDLIGRAGDVLVFVEVKTRRRGDPALAVDAVKQRAVIRAATSFLRRFHADDVPHRFDIVAVSWESDDRMPIVEHWPDAFSPVEFGQVL